MENFNKKLILDKVILNHQITQVIFSYLTVEDLKNCRLTNKTWAREACFHLNQKISVKIQPSLDEVCLNELSTFLGRYRLRHVLFLSLLDYAWYYSVDEDEVNFDTIMTRYMYQNNNRSFVTSICKSNLGVVWPQLLVDLRMEMMMNVVGDGDLLKQILIPLTSLERLAIDFIKFEDAAIQAVPLNSFENLRRLRTFAYRLPTKGRPEFQNDAEYPSHQALLLLFRQIHYLDLRSWKQRVSIDEHYGKVDDCLRVIREACFRLQGIRIHFALEHLPRLTNCGQPLRYMSLWCFGPNSHIEILVKCLAPFASTLESIELVLSSIIEYYLVPTIKLCILPRLQFLGIITNDPTEDIAAVRPDLMDFINLREIFLDNLEKAMPLLRTLIIVIPAYQKQEVWNYIIPANSRTGMELVIPQLTYLAVSLVENCESEGINRLHFQFPKLKKLRHLLHDEGGDIWICEHWLKDYEQQPSLSFGRKKITPLNDIIMRNGEIPCSEYIYHNLEFTYEERPFFQ